MTGKPIVRGAGRKWGYQGASLYLEWAAKAQALLLLWSFGGRNTICYFNAIVTANPTAEWNP